MLPKTLRSTDGISRIRLSPACFFGGSPAQLQRRHGHSVADSVGKVS